MRNAFTPYEKQYLEWADEGFPGVEPATEQFLEHVLDPARERSLWPGQRAGLLRAIYAFEVLGRRNLLLNIVTGGGKTAIIGACIAWLRWVHGVRSFLVLSPNTIVRERLRGDFSGARVFHDFDLFPATHSHYINDLGLHTLESGAALQGMLESGIVLGNIQQLYGGAGNEKLAAVLNFLGDLAVFNDEAHNTPAPEYTDVLKALSGKQVLRLDTTATPDRADGQEPDSEMIYEYGIAQALDDGIVKSTVVYQPDIKSVELTYTDPNTGEQVSVEEIDWEAIDDGRVKATKWVTDTKPRREQLKIALARLEEQRKRAAGRYKPILFVVAVGIADARATQKELESSFGVRALVVTEDSTDEERLEAMRIAEEASPYHAVVSVLMLREGWDVPEVGVIALLRKFSSRVYGQQVIGRGLRKVVRKPEEREILAVVDHPKLDHSWLWELVRAKVKKDVKATDEFDLDEDLPEPVGPHEPELVDPEKIIEVPEPEGGPDGEFDFSTLIDEVPDEDEARKDWPDVLASTVYANEVVEITDVTVKGLKSINLDASGFVKYKSQDELDAEVVDPVEEAKLPPHEELLERLKEQIRALAGELLFEKGFAGKHRGALYEVISDHVDNKFLGGSGMAAASSVHLLYAGERLHDVRAAFMGPGIVSGIVTFPLARVS
jgi:superfamily II DNA or RNA helicase